MSLIAAQVGGGSRRVPTILKCPTHPEKVDKGNKNHFKKQTIESRYQIWNLCWNLAEILPLRFQILHRGNSHPL